jgi:hypothetical protein
VSKWEEWGLAGSIPALSLLRNEAFMGEGLMRWGLNFVCIAVCTIIPLPSGASFAPPAHPLFESDAVHEFRLTFHQLSWWDTLQHNYEDFADPPYAAAEFDWDAIHFDSIGVRFKGNSTYYSYPTEKKSFKLDIDEYVGGQTIYGLDKLNLNNGFKDPSFVREKCCYEVCAAAGLPSCRTNYVALHINDEYWGLYTLIEQVDQEFIESRFGSGEEGNLWKGDPHGTLEYRGPNESQYYGEYELKTNEEENDWSALVELADGLNNTPIEQLPDTLHPLMDVNSALALLAVDNLTVNLDSYAGRCCNYYFYHRDQDSHFVFMNWDLNEAWGCFTYGMPVQALVHLDPFWVVQMPGEHRPLAEVLWQENAYREIHLGHMRRLMAGAAQPDALLSRMEDLRDLIRPYVYADTKKMYSNADFDAAMTTDIGGGPGGVSPGLEPFIRDRDSWLRTQIGTWMPIEDLVLNELMASNDTTIADEHGDYDDWIEITNTGPSTISLSGLALTDDLSNPAAFLFPDVTIQPGEYLLVWADDEPEEGSYHAAFKLSADGEDVYLLESGVIVDETTYGALGSDISWGRWPDGTGDWQVLGEATPGEENQNPEEPEDVILYVNEFLALNDGVNQDEAGEYEDWVEIYNPGRAPVAMGGLFLTDDLANTTKWSFPDTAVGPGGFLLVWCDDNEEDGPLHAGFKLSGDGEEIGLFGRVTAGNQEIDSHAFGPQTADISEGRETDGAETWVFFPEPTPGASNGGTATSELPLAGTFRLLPNCPNPFTSSTRIHFAMSDVGRVRLRVFDLAGREVLTVADRHYGVGEHSVVWDGQDNCGHEVAPGVYITRMDADGFSTVRQIVRLR